MVLLCSSSRKLIQVSSQLVFPELSEWVQCNRKGPKPEEGSRREGWSDIVREEFFLICWFWRQKKVPPARDSGQCVEAGKGKEAESSSSLQKEPAVQHLDFSPLRSTLVFLPPEVQDNQSVFFCALKFIATAVKKKQTRVSGSERAVQNLVVPPRPWAIHPKPPSRCPKPRIVLNPAGIYMLCISCTKWQGAYTGG